MARPIAKTGRSGAVILESIIAIPILVITLMAATQFSTIMLLHHAVMAAATEASREAAKVPTTMATDSARMVSAVEATVTEMLNGTHGLSATPGFFGVMVVVEDSSGMDCGGDTSVAACPVATSVVEPSVVRVTVLVDMEVTAIPNLLQSFGWSTNGRRIEICSDSRRDCF